MSGSICLNGILVRAAPIDFIQRGTHRLVDSVGRLIAILRSQTINLTEFEGQFVAVCGTFEGIIEGLQSILVLSVFIQKSSCPQQQIDFRFKQDCCKKSKCKCKRRGYYPCSTPVLRPPFQPVFQPVQQQPIFQPLPQPIFQPIQQPIQQLPICPPVRICEQDCKKSKVSCCVRCQNPTKKSKTCSKCLKYFTKSKCKKH